MKQERKEINQEVYYRHSSNALKENCSHENRKIEKCICIYMNIMDIYTSNIYIYIF